MTLHSRRRWTAIDSGCCLTAAFAFSSWASTAKRSRLAIAGPACAAHQGSRTASSALNLGTSRLDRPGGQSRPPAAAAGAAGVACRPPPSRASSHHAGSLPPGLLSRSPSLSLRPQDYEAVLAGQPGQAAALLSKAKVHVALKQLEVRGSRYGWLAACLPGSAGLRRTALLPGLVGGHLELAYRASRCPDPRWDRCCIVPHHTCRLPAHPIWPAGGPGMFGGAGQGSRSGC